MLQAALRNPSPHPPPSLINRTLARYNLEEVEGPTRALYAISPLLRARLRIERLTDTSNRPAAVRYLVHVVSTERKSPSNTGDCTNTPGHTSIAGGRPDRNRGIGPKSADHHIAVLIASAWSGHPRGGTLPADNVLEFVGDLDFAMFWVPRAFSRIGCPRRTASLVRSVSSTPQLSRKMTDRAGRRTGSDSHA